MNSANRPAIKKGTGHESPVAATFTALKDLISPRLDIERPRDAQSMQGRRLLITGGTSGLGRALAVNCARRGAQLLIVGRKRVPELEQELQALGAPQVETLACDLADLDQVITLIQTLKTKEPFDSLVLNAGLLPNQTRLTRQGFEEMFAVHFASNLLLLKAFGEKKWLERVLLTSSEAHRSSPEVNPETLGVPPQFGLSDGMKWYGQTKLLLLNQFWLSAPKQQLRAALCPGPIASNIARESPSWVRPLLTPVMRLLFNSPEKAITPLLYFLLEPKEELLSRSSFNYLHMRAWKMPSQAAQSPELQAKLSKKTDTLLKMWLEQATY